MWNPEFEGWYFKHQKGRDTVAFIPGQAKSGAFVQVIWPEGARCFPMPALHVDRKGERVYAPGCRFGRNGISVDLPGIRGEISYGPSLRCVPTSWAPSVSFPWSAATAC